MDSVDPGTLVVLNHVKGGLGNQLFQHVFARSLSDKLGAELVTDESSFAVDPYGRRSWIADMAPGARTGTLAQFSGPGSYLLQEGILHRLKDPLPLPNGAAVLVLSGYWQDEALLDPAVAHMTLARLAIVAERRIPADLVARIRACTNAVAVHVRRLDYAHMGLCTESYYCAAIEQIQQAHPDVELFVFTDEPNFVRHWMDLRGLRFKLVATGDDLGDLYLMAQCKHFVIANSSYSWWAAYWGESNGGLIFCPREWVTIGAARSPCPPRWIHVADAVRPFTLDVAGIALHAARIQTALRDRKPPPTATYSGSVRNPTGPVVPHAHTSLDLIDLPEFFNAMPDHVVVKLPASFPSYEDQSTIVIVCRNTGAVFAHLLQVAQTYIARGFRFEEHHDNGHLHIEAYPPGSTHLSLRFDLLADFSGYRKFVVDPILHTVILDSKRQVLHNGTQVFVPALPHELVVRYLEYVELGDTIPTRMEHLDFIRARGGVEFLPIVSQYTNLVLPDDWQTIVAEEPSTRPAPHMDYVLVWGHGLPHTHQILELIRCCADLQIITIVKRDIADIGQFVQDVYACDTVPFQHLATKTRYLLTMPPQVLFVLLKNHRPQEKYFGEGAFRHIQCQHIKDLKEAVRKQFNPRTPTCERTEDDVIHASDYPSQVAHMLSVLGLPALAHYEREAHPDIDAPYHLAPLGQITVQDVPMDALFANILAHGLVAVKDTPHYQYAIGNKDPYQTYHAQHFGLSLTDDHLPEAFDAKILDFHYGERLANGKLNLIVARHLGDGRYQVLDGVHRAAILASRGIHTVRVGVVAAGRP